MHHPPFSLTFAVRGRCSAALQTVDAAVLPPYSPTYSFRYRRTQSEHMLLWLAIGYSEVAVSPLRMRRSAMEVLYSVEAA